MLKAVQRCRQQRGGSHTLCVRGKDASEQVRYYDGTGLRSVTLSSSVWILHS